jgi:hypothetical protein
MRVLFIISFTLLAISCNQRKTTDSALKTNDSILIKNAEAVIEKKDKADTSEIQMTTSAYAKLILNNKIKPTYNKNAINCLDSLNSHNYETRSHYFEVVKIIASSYYETISNYAYTAIKTYLQNYPYEFLARFTNFSQKEKTEFTEYIASEFYDSGKDYKKKIPSYFELAQTNCQKCSDNYILRLSDLKNDIINNVVEQFR